MENLKDKVVLLVGATGTIGSEIAKLMVKSGCTLYLTGRNTEQLSRIGQSCGLPETQCLRLDLSEPESIETACHSLLEANQIPDVVINAAGIGIIKPFENITAAELQQSLQVNLIGVFLLLQQLIPAMKTRKSGLIINIPGVLGKTPMAGATAYAASKYGLNGMMKSLREELKRTDIRITQLFLGGVDSNFWDHIDLRVQRDKMIVAEEAAKAVWFLCHQPKSGVVSEMVLQPFNHQAI